ncbi:hypothetical protein [Psychroserpens sp. SPM9]|uniref:hypothetical protein n=1 Tax=Psychroserpens sp. SPM9 TaxID=2975598 RepID=UPI0021A2A91D|nr:hypothetical protein [Psychroserpens sp. SPM9]MDG5492730.1 hypothetical protein [Psychroserpens sp. SPM9]
MKSSFLLPNKFKIPGWILLITGLIAGVFLMLSEFESNWLEVRVLALWSDPISIGTSLDSSGQFFNIIENSIVDELIAIAIIVGGLFVGFSKEKQEDEFIYKLRNDSLLWAIIVNYTVLIFAVIFVYDLSFFNILVYNMFTPLLFFIFRFNFLKARA